MSGLRVAVDGRPLQSIPLGGVGRYLKGVVPVLAEQCEMSVLVDARRPTPSLELGTAELIALSAPPGVPGLGWLELSVTPWLRRFGGIFHGAFNALPVSFRGRSVLTVHDLAPQLHPEDFRLGRRLSWRVNMRSSVARARCVATVSEFVKGQLIDYFGLPSERIVVAPDALDPIFGPRLAADAVDLALELDIPIPYIVALGGAPRRGLTAAIEAWRRANRELSDDVSLVVVGQPDLTPEPGLVSLGRVSDAVWATVLAGAQALCYPTRYEGFGLPALEAAGSGTPVVCAPLASLPEVLGQAGCWAADPSPQAIATVLTRLLSDPEWHGQQRAAGLERAQISPTWSQTAAVLLEAYERAAV